MNAVIESPVKLSLTRNFDCPPETLFDAWLDDSWADWLGPEGVICLSCEIDPRVGGKWRVVSRMPDGREVTMNGVYREITRPDRLVFTWHGCFSGPDDTTVTVIFKPRGAGTEMTLIHAGFINEDLRDRHNGGWSATFDRLARHIA
jgi:uncharacterized protein YndB with AHSA1/START domain